jgi:hypothetical protein
MHPDKTKTIAEQINAAITRWTIRIFIGKLNQYLTFQ